MRALWILWMGYRWKWKLMILTIFLWFSTGVQAQCPAPFTDIDPDEDVDRCVFVSTETAANFAEARWECQNLDASADLITITSNDLGNLGRAGFMNTTNYYVGLNDASIPTAQEWVLDCRPYNGLTQPFIDGNPCTSENCNCYQLEDVELTEIDCTATTINFICALSQPTDFPEVLCPMGWIGIKDRCYRYYTQQDPMVNFTRAEAICQESGGNLARANFYDCNFAQILSNRPNKDITYLVGLMDDGGNLEWRDGSVPQAVISIGFGNCYQLGNDAVQGALQKGSCVTAIQDNFICEIDALVPTTEGLPTTDGTTGVSATTGITGTTGITATTEVTATDEGAATTGITVTTGITATTGITVTDEVTATTDSVEPTTDAGSCCPSGTTEIGDLCFTIFENEVTFTVANQTCFEFGGVLARINPFVEANQFLINYFTMGDNIQFPVWIGLRRTQTQPPTFTWTSDNTSLVPSESFWSNGQPQGAVGVNCVFAVNAPGLEGQWFLSNCGSLAYSLCQFQRTFDCDDPCLEQPCDNTGDDDITCSSPGFGIAQCSCNTGFELQTPLGPCLDIDECMVNTPCDVETENCENTIGSFQCVCMSGLVRNSLNNICEPIPVCEGVTCLGSQGGIFCNSNGLCECELPGFELESANGPCLDINECSEVPSVCDLTSTACVNTNGGFQCACLDGFVTDPTSDTRCIPTASPCSSSPCDNTGDGQIECTELGGNTFECSCGTGFSLVSQLGPCDDDDECQTANGGCDPQSTTCENTIGSWMCTCNDGFETLQGDSTACQDINECQRNTDGCDVVSTTCVNSLGSFMCQCRPGFQFQGVQNACSNINECTTQQDNCDDSTTTCVDNVGSFTCQCQTNFVRVNPTTCRDACQDCDTTTTECVVTNDAVTCQCLSGFTPISGNSTSCQASASVCCPTPNNTAYFNNLYLTSEGTCVLFDETRSNTFDNFKSSICSIAAATIGLTGGRLAEFSNYMLNNDLMTLATDQAQTATRTFPPNVYVDLRRSDGATAFVWNDGSNTELPTTSSEWIEGSPLSGANLDCGSVVELDSVLGYTNIDCTRSANAFCFVDTTTSCSQALTARTVIPVITLNNRAATFSPECQATDSTCRRSVSETLTPVLQKAIRDEATITIRGLRKGSIIAYVEITIRSPQRVRTYQQLREALLNIGEMDENGIISVTTSSGDSISFDSNKLEVQDRNDYICHSNTCQNGGTCHYDSTYIEANCRCMDGFTGTRCEAVIGESDTGLIVGLSVAMVVILLLFVSCFCCLCLMFKNKTHQRSKMTYQYQPPIVSSQIKHPYSRTGARDTHRRLVAQPSARLEDGTIRFPRVIRNRGVEGDTEMYKFGQDNNDFYKDDLDVESSVDEKRLSHFEKIFSHATALNSHMSSRGDGSSVQSGPSSSTTSICKAPISEATSDIQQFDRPYTADGTENI